VPAPTAQPAQTAEPARGCEAAEISQSGIVILLLGLLLVNLVVLLRHEWSGVA